MHLDLQKYRKLVATRDYIIGLVLSLVISYFILLNYGPWYVRAAIFIVIGLTLFAKRPLWGFLAILIGSIFPGAALPWKMANNIIGNITFNYFELSFILVFLYWLLYKGFGSEVRSNITIIRGMIIFFLANLMSLAVSNDFALTLSQSIYFFSSSLAVSLLTLSLVKKGEDFLFVIRSLAVCLCGVVLVSVLEIFIWKRPIISYFNPYTTYQDMIVAWDFSNQSYYRAGSTLGNPNVSGAFAVLLLPFFIVLNNKNDLKLKQWVVISIIALFVQSFLSYSRAAWADTIAILLLWWSKLFSVKTVVKRIFIISATLFALFNIYTALVPEFKILFEKRFNPKVVNSIDFTHRMGSYVVALNVLKESPMLGIGFYSYKNLYRSLSVIGMENIKTPDNMFLRILIDNGIMGLTAYIVLLCLVFMKIRRRSLEINQPDIYYIGWVTFMVFVIESFSFYIMFSLPLRFTFWVITGLLLSEGANEYFTQQKTEAVKANSID